MGLLYAVRALCGYPVSSNMAETPCILSEALGHRGESRVLSVAWSSWSGFCCSGCHWKLVVLWVTKWLRVATPNIAIHWWSRLWKIHSATSRKHQFLSSLSVLVLGDLGTELTGLHAEMTVVVFHWVFLHTHTRWICVSYSAQYNAQQLISSARRIQVHAWACNKLTSFQVLYGCERIGHLKEFTLRL